LDDQSCKHACPPVEMGSPGGPPSLRDPDRVLQRSRWPGAAALPGVRLEHSTSKGTPPPTHRVCRSGLHSKCLIRLYTTIQAKTNTYEWCLGEKAPPPPPTPPPPTLHLKYLIEAQDYTVESHCLRAGRPKCFFFQSAAAKLFLPEVRVLNIVSRFRYFLACFRPI
jgi:hypothetical protein